LKTLDYVAGKNFLPPMLAESATGMFVDPRWVYEVKWDGVRTLFFVGQGEHRLLSRSGRQHTEQFPELGIVSRRVRASNAVLDGELVVQRPDTLGHRFSDILRRVQVRGSRSSRRLVQELPAVAYLFDLLFVDGRDTRGEPLLERKEQLRELLEWGGPLQYSSHVGSDEAEGLYRLAEQRGLEGLMAKRAGSTYVHRRSGDWLKIRIAGQANLVIGGYTHSPARRGFGALLVGTYDREGNLRYLGGVGTGFSDRELMRVADMLRSRASPDCPFAEEPRHTSPVTWVRPELVCRVDYTEITGDGRLRHPVYRGLVKRPGPHGDRGDADAWETLPKKRGSAALPSVEGHKSPTSFFSSSRRGAAAPPAVSPNLPGFPLGPRDGPEIEVVLEGKSLLLTNLDKVLWRDEGFTKRDVVNFFAGVATAFLRYARERPLVLTRYPDGPGGQWFYQKRAPEHRPEWVQTTRVPSNDKDGETIDYVVADDILTILWLANLGALEVHPWSSRAGPYLDFPDFVIIDLDPAPPAGFAQVVEASSVVRGILDSCGATGYVKTSGATGLHILVPVEARYPYEQIRAFSQLIGTIALNRRPDLFTLERRVKDRTGKVYLDYLQNIRGKTIVGPYCLRPRPGAPVSTPLRWKEVTPTLDPAAFTIDTVGSRFDAVGDLWADMWNRRHRLEDLVSSTRGLV